jgi:hypothetical protein
LQPCGLRLSRSCCLHCGSDFNYGGANLWQSCLTSQTTSGFFFRNSNKHFRGRGGLTAAENRSIIDRVKELMHTDPDELLMKQKHRQYWLANMEIAISVLQNMQNGTMVNGSMPRFRCRRRKDSHTRKSLGSVIYRRQRRRPQELMMDTARVT